MLVYVDAYLFFGRKDRDVDQAIESLKKSELSTSEQEKSTVTCL